MKITDIEALHMQAHIEPDSNYRQATYPSSAFTPAEDEPLICPLCAHADVVFYHQDCLRAYWQCTCCALVFSAARGACRCRDREITLRSAPERSGRSWLKARRFLSRFATPLLAQVAPGAHGLDFGCGPGPALAQMLTEAGMIMRVYDVFYASDATVWSERYDFITTTEVAEHLYAPAQGFDRLFATLKPGGLLGVMTKRVLNPTAFAKWHYITDATHVCFYSEETFVWVAAHWQATLTLPAKDVAFLQKQT